MSKIYLDKIYFRMIMAAIIFVSMLPKNLSWIIGQVERKLEC